MSRHSLVSHRVRTLALATGLVALIVVTLPVVAEEIRGTVKSVDTRTNEVVVTDESGHHDYRVLVNKRTRYEGEELAAGKLAALKAGSRVVIGNTITAASISVADPDGHAAATGSPRPRRSMLGEFWHNFRHNLFKPLLLFFYLGFLVPILRVKFEFPYVIYQGLTIYLLLAIGWHGGEELSSLDPNKFASVIGFMVTGFATNFVVGIVAYRMLKFCKQLRAVDRATVAGYYGSDSAGTFVTCQGVLISAGIAMDAYMPVMLAIMEIPGCLVALYLVSRLRHQGMDARGNMPDEPGYDPAAAPLVASEDGHHGHATSAVVSANAPASTATNDSANGQSVRSVGPAISGKLLHEVFLNSGLYLLFGGIAIGFISGLQGKAVTHDDDQFFVVLFQGVLCLFLLEMGMTASRKLRDLHLAGWRYVVFGLTAPNVFATSGILIAHLYSMTTGTHFLLGTYVLFAVLCGAASYIAVPAVQRMAIPEASPTLPLAASLGLTFSYNVTIGIPLYIEIAKAVLRYWPV